MRIDNMFNHTTILGAAMQATVVRDGVIANNIANADTPGFKRSAVNFEAALADAVADFRQTGRLDLSGVQPRIFLEYDWLNYRIDENNVDIEFEMVQLFQNSERLNVMAAGVINHYRTLNMVISSM